MKNWTQRLTLFAVVGAILSSAVLVGCGGSEDDGGDTNTTGNTAANNAAADADG